MSDEPTQPMRIAMQTAAKAYVRRWLDPADDVSEGAERTAIGELYQLFVNMLTLIDDQRLDGTDFAHPAYWRGELAGVRGAVRVLRNALEHGCSGTCADPELERLKQDICKLRDR